MGAFNKGLGEDFWALEHDLEGLSFQISINIPPLLVHDYC